MIINDKPIDFMLFIILFFIPVCSLITPAPQNVHFFEDSPERGFMPLHLNAGLSHYF